MYLNCPVLKKVYDTVEISQLKNFIVLTKSREKSQDNLHAYSKHNEFNSKWQNQT